MLRYRSFFLEEKLEQLNKKRVHVSKYWYVCYAGQYQTNQYYVEVIGMIVECAIDVCSDNTGQLDEKEDGKQGIFYPNSS